MKGAKATCRKAHDTRVIEVREFVGVYREVFGVI